MYIKSTPRPAATGRGEVIALGSVQPESYLTGPMHIVRVGDLHDAARFIPQFIVDPIIPRAEVTLLSGHGDIGKSFFGARHCGQRRLRAPMGTISGVPRARSDRDLGGCCAHRSLPLGTHR